MKLFNYTIGKAGGDEEAHIELCPLVGQKLPNLSLEIYHHGEQKKVRLSDYQGQWLVLFFYPADFTFICPTELSEMAELYPEFQAAGCEVVSVSTDSVFVHKAWHEQSPSVAKITFPMASDRTGALSQALGVYIKEAGESYRASFLVDTEGVVRAYEVHDNSIGRSSHELLRKLQAAQYVHDHPGEVCPAKWRPGDKTLRPGMDLVGKI